MATNLTIAQKMSNNYAVGKKNPTSV